MFFNTYKKDEIKTVKVNAAIRGEIGLIEEDVYLFKGIPFAQPPVGELRWKAPRKLATVSETIKAFSHKSKCTQPKENEFILDRGVTEGGEDCLYLNIFVPKGNVDISKIIINNVLDSWRLKYLGNRKLL